MRRSRLFRRRVLRLQAQPAQRRRRRLLAFALQRRSSSRRVKIQDAKEGLRATIRSSRMSVFGLKPLEGDMKQKVSSWQESMRSRRRESAWGGGKRGTIGVKDASAIAHSLESFARAFAEVQQKEYDRQAELLKEKMAKREERLAASGRKRSVRRKTKKKHSGVVSPISQTRRPFWFFSCKLHQRRRKVLFLFSTQDSRPSRRSLPNCRL